MPISVHREPRDSTGDAWVVSFSGFDASDEGRRETLCGLGNGYLATRGATTGSVGDGVHYPGTYIAGVYNRLSTPLSDGTVEDESLVNLPDWTWCRFTPGGSHHGDDGRVLYHRIELNLRRGLLRVHSRRRDENGRHLTFHEERLVHIEQPHLVAQRITVVPEDWSGTLSVWSGINGDVHNGGVARYGALAARHLRTVDVSRAGHYYLLLVAETSQSHVRVAEVLRTVVRVNGALIAPTRHDRSDSSRALEELQVEVSPGNEVVVERTVSVHTSGDRAISEASEAAVETLRSAGDFDGLLMTHVRGWSVLWRNFDFELADTRVARMVRLHLFHLLQTVSPHSVGRDVGVPARGLHGEAYRGHVFWDELFVQPILALRMPSVSRSLLEYRFRRLPAARRAAAAEGLRGAMFPWQSGSTGREESQRLHLNPLSGRWLPDSTYRQRHVGLAVAYNAWRHYEATGDEEFLAEIGAELLIEIARFWSSLATFDPVRDRFVLRGVVGPDEFHTGYTGAESDGVDNNAYTNVMAAWMFGRALEATAALDSDRRAELLDRVGVAETELRRWDRLSRELFVPFHTGFLLQFEGYERLRPLDWSAYRQRYGNLQRLDRILEAEGDSVAHYQVSKQADALMLLFLLSSEDLVEVLARLGYEFDPAAIPRMIDFYLARTVHGSTLSSVVHAWVLARANRDDAVLHFQRALATDLHDIQGGTTAEGIHLAAMAGSVDLLQRCYAGVEVREGELHLNPQWPAELGALRFDIRVRRLRVRVHVHDRTAELEAFADNSGPLWCVCRGVRACLDPGEHLFLGTPVRRAAPSCQSFRE